MKQPTPSDFIVNVKESSVSVIFKPSNSDYNFVRLADPGDIARYGPLSQSPNVRHGNTDGTFVGCQGDHHPLTVREMQRTPRGGQWYAKSVSNLLARACVI